MTKLLDFENEIDKKFVYSIANRKKIDSRKILEIHNKQ